MTIYLNDHEVGTSVFSGGECHVKLDPQFVFAHNVIQSKIETSDDIIKLLLCVDAIRRLNENALIDLIIPYFPYARQDRVVAKGEAFSLDVMANLINNLNLHSVKIIDPHSLQTERLIKNCIAVPQEWVLQNSMLYNFIINKKLNLVAPDKGAIDKINKLKERFNQNNYFPKIVYAHKKRDIDTGKIIETTLNYVVEPLDYIFIDDICDGGNTFTKLALKFKSNGARNIYLYVTHGIFSNGLDCLHEHFSHIFCYHTFLKDYDKTFLTVFNQHLDS